MNAEETLLQHEKELEAHAFTYRGGGYWHDAVTSTIVPSSVAYKILQQRLHPKWHKDNMGDYVIEIPHPTTGILVRGRIIRCHVTRPYKKYGYRTEGRWLLLVNDHAYGFWKTMREAVARFTKDCVPKSKPVGDDYDGETFCWHKVPYGKGPYCTGCGGLIRKVEVPT